MKNQISNIKHWTSRALLAVGTGSLFLAAACMSSGNNVGQNASTPSGSEVWAQNCARCHNYRSPSEFSDSEWDAIMFHMRVRARLTADEYRATAEFLKSSN